MFFSKKPAVAWIVVFLGNPGSRYDNTRHNAGFMTADAVEKNTGAVINRMKFSSLTTTAHLGGQNVFLMKPQTFMNLSGGAVRQAMSYFKIPLSSVLAVSDDVSLHTGALRIRQKGSAGGHNGLKDIIARCGGEDFPRIKIGVGAPPHGDYDLADWVLSKLCGKDEDLIKLAAVRAAEAIEAIIAFGADNAMEKFNHNAKQL